MGKTDLIARVDHSIAIAKAIRHLKRQIKKRTTAEWWPNYFPMPKSKATQPRIAPLGNRLQIVPPLAEKDRDDLRSEGGIFLPEQSGMTKVPHPYFLTKVLAVGPDVKGVKAGDTIIADRGRMIPVNVPSEASIVPLLEATLIRDSDVLGVVRPGSIKT